MEMQDRLIEMLTSNNPDSWALAFELAKQPCAERDFHAAVPIVVEKLMLQRKEGNLQGFEAKYQITIWGDILPVIFPITLGVDGRVVNSKANKDIENLESIFNILYRRLQVHLFTDAAMYQMAGFIGGSGSLIRMPEHIQNQLFKNQMPLP